MKLYHIEMLQQIYLPYLAVKVRRLKKNENIMLMKPVGADISI